MTARDDRVLRPMVIAAMTGCVAISLTDLIEMMFTEWDGTYLVVACILAALEACYSYRLVARRRLRGGDALRFRAIEILVILLAVKAGSYVGREWSSLLADLRSWPSRPRMIFDAEDFLASIVVLFAWLSATSTSRDLERISEPWGIRPSAEPFVRSITNRFFWGGAVLMVTAGLTRVGISALLKLERPPVPRLVANVLAYFLLGLLTLGQIHFARLSRQWESQKTQGVQRVSRRWVRYSLLLIGVAVFLAVIIPIGYAGGVLETGAAVVNAIIYVLSLVAWLASTVLALLMWLISGLFESLLGRRGFARPPLTPLPRESLLPQVRVPLVIPEWLELVRTAVFWAATLAMLIYVLRSYLRDHPEIVETLRRLRVLLFLRALLDRLRHGMAGAVRTVRALTARSASAGSERAGPFRLRRIRPQSPRERVLYYYMSTLRRAAQLGVGRRHNQTPYEYGSVLGPMLTDSGTALDSLTEVFVEARYSRHDVDRSYQNRARAYWREVTTALRALRSERRVGAEE